MCMKEWLEEYKGFWKNKFYCLMLGLTGLLSYGYLVTHQTVGIDDTPYAYYFEEGLAAIVGRWVMFLVNKVLHISEFAPFVTDLCGVLLFMAGVTVWCILLKRIFEDRVPMWGYTLFSCLFLSNPLIGEVFTYYLHNGVGTGYLFCGLSLTCFFAGIKRLSWKKAWKHYVASAVFMWIALGCYESFMIVWLVGVCVLLCSCCIVASEKKKENRPGVFTSLCIAAAVALCALILRSIMVQAVTVIFGLQELKGQAVQRSVTEMLGWIVKPDTRANLWMILKRTITMYGIFGYAYYPIKIYVIACVLSFLICVYQSLKKKDLWITFLWLCSFIASYLLVFVEGKATLYRSAQFLPLFSAWGLFLVIYEGSCLKNWLMGKRREKQANGKDGWKIAGKITECAVFVLLCMILWNQCTDLNKWFYIDELKYEDAKNTANEVAYKLEKSFDTTKPVVFTGKYLVPQGIVQDAFVPYNSKTFYQIYRLTSILDEHLLEKFNYGNYGVWVAQTPALSVIDWGRDAFGTDAELVRFFNMHGHLLVPMTDESVYEAAELDSIDLPTFPQEGSIVDMGDYIIVHF